MLVKTISGQVSNTVTLGAGGYAKSITITNTGSVAPNIFGADAIASRARCSIDFCEASTSELNNSQGVSLS